MTTEYRTVEIISANPDDPVERGGWNLYAPEYGETFLGNFRTVQATANEALRLAGNTLESVKVM